MRSIQWLPYLHQEMTIGPPNIHLTIGKEMFFHTIKTTFFETLKMVDAKKVVFIDHTESNYFSIHFPKNQQIC